MDHGMMGLSVPRIIRGQSGPSMNQASRRTYSLGLDEFSLGTLGKQRSYK